MKNEIYLNVADKIGNPSALTQEDCNLIYSEIHSRSVTILLFFLILRNRRYDLQTFLIMQSS